MCRLYIQYYNVGLDDSNNSNILLSSRHIIRIDSVDKVKVKTFKLR